jgi:hypothetical protein
MTVRLKTPVNKVDCECPGLRVVGFVEQGPVKGAFSQKA